MYEQTTAAHQCPTSRTLQPAVAQPSAALSSPTRVTLATSIPPALMTSAIVPPATPLNVRTVTSRGARAATGLVEMQALPSVRTEGGRLAYFHARVKILPIFLNQVVLSFL